MATLINYLATVAPAQYGFSINAFGGYADAEGIGFGGRLVISQQVLNIFKYGIQPFARNDFQHQVVPNYAHNFIVDHAGDTSAARIGSYVAIQQTKEADRKSVV